MDPRTLLFAGGKPYIEAAGLIITADGIWPVGDSGPSVPTAPSSLAATAISTSQIDLTWTDNSSDETSFRIERSPDGSTGWASVGTNAAGDNTFSNTGLTCGTQYFYRVFAVNAVGDSAASNTDDTTTTACPSTVTASGTTVTIATSGTVTITGPGGVVYSGGSGTVTLPPGSYTWTDDLGGSGSFSVSAGGNRMGGSGAIRRPPRTFLHGRN